METTVRHSSTLPNSTASHSAGTSVIYGLHGKCGIEKIESREIQGSAQEFYKLVPQKSSFSRSTRQEPAIWIPVNSTLAKSLRPAMGPEQAKEAMTVLLSREYYFSLSEAWSSVQPKLEACIHTEGGIGLAMVASYLLTLKKKQVVASQEVSRMIEAVNRVLLREISEALGETIRAIEEKINKGIKQKLLPDA